MLKVINLTKLNAMQLQQFYTMGLISKADYANMLEDWHNYNRAEIDVLMTNLAESGLVSSEPYKQNVI